MAKFIGGFLVNQTECSAAQYYHKYGMSSEAGDQISLHSNLLALISTCPALLAFPAFGFFSGF